MKKIILIKGKKRAGKDYFCSLLKKELEFKGKTVKILSFASPMKRIISTTFGISEDELETYKNNPDKVNITTFKEDFCINNTNFREILQRFGTEGMKTEFGADVWVQLLKTQANDTNVDYILVPDFRFLCEEISPFTIEIINRTINTIDSHISENELNNLKCLYEIDNTGYIDLEPQIKKLVEELLNS